MNLPVADSLKGVKVMSDVMDHALEICKLLKYLPRRDAILHELKEEMSAQVPGLHNLCPTRWTVHAASLESIRFNYEHWKQPGKKHWLWYMSQRLKQGLMELLP